MNDPCYCKYTAVYEGASNKSELNKYDDILSVDLFYLKRYSSHVNCNEGHEGEAQCDEADFVHPFDFALVLVHHQESSLP